MVSQASCSGNQSLTVIFIELLLNVPNMKQFVRKTTYPIPAGRRLDSGERHEESGRDPLFVRYIFYAPFITHNYLNARNRLERTSKSCWQVTEVVAERKLEKVQS